MTPFRDPAVEAHFNAYPPRVRSKLLSLRELVFETASKTKEAGELQETMKWGEPAYVTARTKSGSTIRMDWKARTPDQYALYFHCRSGLVDTFRTLFPNELRFEGDRALVFELDGRIPKDALAFCIGAALTYHSSKKASKGKPEAAA
jgi:hypothetical protein